MGLHPEYQGVFLDESPDGSHYEISADNTRTFGTIQSSFIKWTGPASITLPPTNEGPVVFLNPDSTVVAKALYKGHLITTSTENAGTQSKLSKGGTGPTSYALVYESAGDVWYSSTSNGGVNWSPEIMISGGDGKASNPSITSINRGYPYNDHQSIIAWEEKNPYSVDGYRIWASVKSDDYATILGPYRVEENNVSPPLSATPVASSTYIFWRGASGVEYANFSSPQNFPPIYTVPGTANAIGFGAEAMNDGKMKIAWATSSEGIHYSTSTNAGSSWSSPLTIEDNYANIINDQPVITSDKDDAGCVAWRQRNTTTASGSIKFAKIDPTGSIFIYQTFTSCSGGYPSNPSISGYRNGSSTDVSLAWLLPDNKTAAVLLRNGIWSSPFILSTGVQNVGISKSENASEINANRMLISIGAAAASPYPILLTPLGNASPPETPDPSFPLPGANGVTLPPTLTWECVFGASTYQLVLDNESSFSVPLTLNQSGISGSSYLVSNLSPNTTYYWKVRASNTNGEGSYSTVKSFTTSASSPPVAPALNGMVYNTHPKLKWTKTSGVPTYKLYRYICEDFQDCISTVQLKYQGSDTQYVDGGLIVGDTHDPTLAWYYVTVTTASGTSQNSNKISFNLDIEEVDKPQIGAVEAEPIPTEYSLSANYPNPFNPSTNIDYTLPEASHVTMSIYNTFGQAVTTLVNEFQSAGYKSVTFDASSYPSGIYFYQIRAGSFKTSKKMIFVK